MFLSHVIACMPNADQLAIVERAMDGLEDDMMIILLLVRYVLCFMRGTMPT